MRFQVTQVMDAIEQRLTTDAVGAQAVVDLGEVIRHVPLDGGRRVNLVRIGMVVDALSRYLLDGGALLYGVVERGLLSESALTSKERMVLSRWADDGVIEVAVPVAGRAAEVADLTGLPLVTLGDASGFGGRALRLVPRHGVAGLVPMAEDVAEAAPGEAVGRAAVPDQAEQPEAPSELPLPVQAFGDRLARGGRLRLSRHRDPPPKPNSDHTGRLARQWRCDEFECPAFGEARRIGQPVPRLRGTTPVCPRHDQPLTDTGERPPAYPVSMVVDDLPRRRFVVAATPVPVGQEAGTEAGGSLGPDGDSGVVSVARWLHPAAANWISPVHLRLSAEVDGLVVTDESERGTVVWQRTGPDDPGTTRTLHRESYRLGEWDSVELYTGIELVRGDRRRGLVAPDEPESVLVDAPTAALPQLSPAPAAAAAAR